MCCLSLEEYVGSSRQQETKMKSFFKKKDELFPKYGESRPKAKRAPTSPPPPLQTHGQIWEGLELFPVQKEKKMFHLLKIS